MAFLDFVLAEGASESWPALALETLQRVAAGAAVLARLTPAVVDAVLSNFMPVKPRAYRQQKSPSTSWPWPPLRQGLLGHSST